jgi:hypothetical protein
VEYCAPTSIAIHVYHVSGAVSSLHSRETSPAPLPSSPGVAGSVPDCSSSREANFCPSVSPVYRDQRHVSGLDRRSYQF